MQNIQFNRKTVGLIILVLAILLLILVISFQVIRNQQSNQLSSNPTVQQVQPTQSPADTLLYLKLNKLNNQNTSLPSTVDIYANAGTDKFTGAQFTLTYDPKVLKNVTVTSGNYIANPAELINKVDPVKGTISYAIAMSPAASHPSSGTGILATISFNLVQNNPNSSSSIEFQDQPIVTDWRYKDTSVLKSASGLTINFATKQY